MLMVWVSEVRSVPLLSDGVWSMLLIGSVSLAFSATDMELGANACF